MENPIEISSLNFDESLPHTVDEVGLTQMRWKIRWKYFFDISEIRN